MFARQGNLFARPFDAVRLMATGEPVLVIDDVMQSMNAVHTDISVLAAQCSISESGDMSYVPGGAYPDLMRQLVTIDRTGSVQTLSSNEKPYLNPRLSPDGRKIAYCTEGKQNNIFVFDLDRKISQPLTVEGENAFPIWRPPHGEKVTFVTLEKDGRYKIVARRAKSTSWPDLGSQRGGAGYQEQRQIKPQIGLI